VGVGWSIVVTSKGGDVSDEAAKALAADKSEPWGFYGDPGELPVLPGYVAAMRRAEAAERAEEARRAGEVQERVDARLAMLSWEAQQFAAMRGLPFDPRHPFEHLPSVVQRADRMFAAQDAEARRLERLAAQEAGLEHLLPQFVGPPEPPRLSGGEGSVTSGPDAPAAVSRANPLSSRIRQAFNRWARRSSSGCRCAACDPTAVRGESGEHREIIRNTEQYKA
jgi:hypothetical protein